MTTLNLSTFVPFYIYLLFKNKKTSIAHSLKISFNQCLKLFSMHTIYPPISCEQVKKAVHFSKQVPTYRAVAFGSLFMFFAGMARSFLR